MSETPHLDAERLAALMDGTLSRAERAAAERHAADCGECLQLLAAMVRTEPVPVRQSWRLPAVARWAVPLAAAATAVALWVNADRRATPPAPARVASQAHEPDARAIDAAAPATEAAKAPAETARDTQASSRARTAAKPVAKDAATPATQEEARRQLARDERTTEVTGEAKLAERPPQAATAPTAAPIPTGAVASSPAAPSPPPVVAPLRPDAANEPGAAFSTQRQADASDVEFASPDPMIRWRVRGTTVARSTDGGRTWSNAVVAFHAAVRAGSSPSPQVAWVVGRQGLVMRTTDGLSWIRGGSPGPIDLVAVRAHNGLEADVIAVDGRVFRTTDGGRTWIAQEVR